MTRAYAWNRRPSINSPSTSTDSIPILELIASEAALHKNYELATSVKGIGPQTAMYMLITTENFTLFKDSRKYACYAGIVPFDHRSRTYMSRKSRVSSMANKRIKTLLSSAAASAIQSNWR